MKRIGFLILTLLIPFFILGQTENNDNLKNCLFGYVSDNQEEFHDVVNYIKNHKIKILFVCEQEQLIFLQLNKKYKDPSDLFTVIEKNYTGKCFYKSDKDELMKYSKCKEEYIKNNFEK